ncbi:hypothetical protein GGR56DRAFT_677355 [Xylariaceae sp. FL0804]|nr:hypothetical protein GGR56DRAFT_677355 [Xylariaceae sp. FL0804]
MGGSTACHHAHHACYGTLQRGFNSYHVEMSGSCFDASLYTQLSFEMVAPTGSSFCVKLVACDESEGMGSRGIDDDDETQKLEAIFACAGRAGCGYELAEEHDERCKQHGINACGPLALPRSIGNAPSHPTTYLARAVSLRISADQALRQHLGQVVARQVAAEQAVGPVQHQHQASCPAPRLGQLRLGLGGLHRKTLDIAVACHPCIPRPASETRACVTITASTDAGIRDI